MTTSSRFTLALGMALAGLLLALPTPAPGCAVARKANQSVEIASETAVIVWDAATRTEHFIRRASFLTKSTDFGFLVPTPTQPELGESSDAAFAALGKLTAPETITHWIEPSGIGIGCSASKRPDSVGSSAGVQVLEEKRVAGYDAAVLAAADPEALTRWLQDHGYTYDPALADWVAHYVQAGWTITAFKIARQSETDRGASTAAVRMSFRTDTPFYPYKEPVAPLPTGGVGRRLLRVFFLGEGKVQGSVRQWGKSWPGHLVHAAPLPDDDRASVWRDLGVADVPGRKWWLTEFEDSSDPRPATDDVYFSPTTEQQPIRRPPNVKYLYYAGPEVCCCPPLLVVGVVVLLGMRWRRRHR